MIKKNFSLLLQLITCSLLMFVTLYTPRSYADETCPELLKILAAVDADLKAARVSDGVREYILDTIKTSREKELREEKERKEREVKEAEERKAAEEAKAIEEAEAKSPELRKTARAYFKSPDLRYPPSREGREKILDFLEQRVFSDPEFHKDPELYMNRARRDRGNTQESRFPSDQAFDFLKHLEQTNQLKPFAEKAKQNYPQIPEGKTAFSSEWKK